MVAQKNDANMWSEKIDILICLRHLLKQQQSSNLKFYYLILIVLVSLKNEKFYYFGSCVIMGHFRAIICNLLTIYSFSVPLILASFNFKIFKLERSNYGQTNKICLGMENTFCASKTSNTVNINS